MTAYWIARVEVTDEESYSKYAALAGPAIAKHGGTFLARGGDYHILEGFTRDRNVVVAFTSMDAAKACYASPEYQEALAFATGASERDLYLVDGVD